MIAYNTSIVRDGLVLHLDAANVKSYPGSGIVWKDLSGLDNNGTLVNGVGYSADNKGTMVFDGVNDYAELSNYLPSTTLSSFTISMVVKRDGNGPNWPRLFVNTQVNKSITITQINQLDSVLFRLATSAGNREYNLPAGTLILNQWKFLSFSYDGSTMRAYVNDNEYGSGNTINLTINSVDPLYLPNIGGENATHAGGVASHFIGNIGLTYVYARALSLSEIRQNFEATRGRYGI
jgi:hypothetical protein